MKLSFTQLAKDIAADRHFMVVLLVLGVVSLLFSGYVAFNLHPSELQIVTHYSAFGTTNFYRDKWYYFGSFIIFGLLNVIIYGALACKLFIQKGRALAIPFAWLGVLAIVIASTILAQILKIAALS
jgi:hypothetical protein